MKQGSGESIVLPAPVPEEHLIDGCAPQILDPGRTDPVAGPSPSYGMIAAWSRWLESSFGYLPTWRASLCCRSGQGASTPRRGCRWRCFPGSSIGAMPWPWFGPRRWSAGTEQAGACSGASSQDMDDRRFRWNCASWAGRRAAAGGLRRAPSRPGVARWGAVGPRRWLPHWRAPACRPGARGEWLRRTVGALLAAGCTRGRCERDRASTAAS